MNASPEEAREALRRIVTEAQGGSPQAFEEMVESTERFLRKLCYPIVGSELIDDALQETYLTVFRHIHQLKESGAFLSWLSRIALHACYKTKKKKLPQAELSPSVGAEDPTEETVNRISLKQALDRLERNDRDILILREMMQLSYQDIANTLNIAEGTVKSRLNGARKRLKERFEI